ncbi:tetratricopeptide repeat protein [Agrobacterium sp. ES01]|uniref:tetratricopeptide repeat protein n=1 Tax=Agrobacterium sp. ES01 TaxID=3420714 RepID=UPI003D0CB52E
MIIRTAPRIAFFVAALALQGVLSGSAVSAQEADPAITRGADDAVPLERSGRASRPAGDVTSETKAGPVLNESNGGTGGEAPASGITLFERMGAPLPDLPPEKTYEGPVDDAYGAYQRGLYLTAIDKALPRAQLGDPAAQTLIAELMSQGLGVKRDTKGAAFWYSQAAAGGYPAAMFKYAMLLMQGRDVKRDKAKADEYMKKAADAGNASAQFNWAQTLVTDNPGQKGLELALPYYEKSADQGIADAQYAVSQLYRTIIDLPEEKRAQARSYLARAAKAGFDTAQLDMGIWLVNGIGGEKDYDEGFRWLSIAANRGNVVAQNRLSHLYINALGTRPDPVEAAKWYVLSRRAGLKDTSLEDFYLGLTDDQQKQAIDRANRFRVS